MKRLIPRTTKPQQRRNITRLLVKHVVAHYGTDNPLEWPSDLLVDLARELRKLTPRNGW